ncbi:hypothetical protein [Rathayibacter iranicus]|uniref:Uncharacterized protein n=1 Tax=Rathayibacter iranicus TaxID=59737 RepID=A0AAD1ENA6_9MICO|nr:hypothetical protein [Rathayibacter iranicus]AZZ56535.1 hypothetical protein C7V51_12085 [Rathayibacter iranicus]MWV31922.1 hypothetical protein [Rathayibacter iranicus NCPPB 2253 = VKM Ac-1602]PPI43678.1 hypothetical protein C5E09_11010 [Rathayibacter iranicus]PPI58797.1 hypothetical protein C5E08_11925 [Rathayibacter iranicus]PPI69782.1 hypothetical protein C5E01_10975 [Rathayibacter iranicus]
MSRFLERIRARVNDGRDPRAATLVWVRGAEDADGAAVVLYRERPEGPVLGRIYRLGEYAAMFDSHLSIEDLADIAFADDLADPTGTGTENQVLDRQAGLEEGSGTQWV